MGPSPGSAHSDRRHPGTGASRFDRLRPGDRVAVLSPSFAAPAIFPQVHEQALQRIRDDLGLTPVEFATTRRHASSPADRAADITAAFADPEIRAVFATIGGEDQVTVVPLVDDAVLRHNPKPFFGYSDNTHLLNHLHRLGVGGFYGGSTQVQIGSGPGIDDVHLRSLRAALFGEGPGVGVSADQRLGAGDGVSDGGTVGRAVEIELTDPGEAEDFGVDWASARALTEFGERRPTRPWEWVGPAADVAGPTWGGCLESLVEIGMAGRYPRPEDLRGAILMVETSEEVPPVSWVRRWMRALGERGILAEVAGVIASCPPTSTLAETPDEATRRGYADDQAHAIIATVAEYNAEVPVCVGIPFGHTRPQWIVPYGGTVRLDGVNRRVFARY
ncbi:S66 peptidase family protein [Corynebacterium sp. NPDC060344]|uniref:S66 family peptidase n=1 Tax=Corynebacterium sp. NPDC060344 TaxID=3347101 RepID=UPI00365C23C0